MLNYVLVKMIKEQVIFLLVKLKKYFSHNPKFEKNLKINIARNKIEDASHHMGGLRYSNNNKLSNVDRNLKIRGLKNIYVCSSAVFPTSRGRESYNDNLCIKFKAS